MRKTILLPALILASTAVGMSQTVEESVVSLIRELENEPQTVVVIEDEADIGAQTAPTGQEPNFQVVPKAQPGTPEYEAKIEKLREKRRRDVQQRIVRLGPPAVPFVGRAMSDRTLKYRDYLAEALTAIADPRATPFLIQYLDEGLAQMRYAESLAKQGEAKLAEEQRKHGLGVVMTASDALQALTGMKYGSDSAAWKAWWEANKSLYR